MTEYQPLDVYQDVPGLGEVSREEWGKMVKAVGEQNQAHRKAWEEAQRAAGQVWTAVYWRYYNEYKDEEFSLEEAKQILVYGEEAGEMSAVGVLCPDGTMLKYSYDWDKEVGLD